MVSWLIVQPTGVTSSLHLFLPSCPTVRRSVGPSVCLSVCQACRPLAATAAAGVGWGDFVLRCVRDSCADESFFLPVRTSRKTTMSAEGSSEIESESENNNSESVSVSGDLAGASSRSMNSDDDEGKREEAGGDLVQDLASKSPAELIARLVEAIAREKLAEDKAKLAEDKAKLETERRLKAEKEAALFSGNYYSTIEQVWTNKVRHFENPVYFDRIRRDSAPDFSSPDGINYYRATLKKAIDPASIVVPEPVPDPAPAAAASTTSSPAVSSARKQFPTHRTMWPVDVFGSPYTKHMHLAHLVPHSPKNSTLYFDVATWALGLQEEAEGEGQRPKPPKWDTVQKAIHGATTVPSKGDGKQIRVDHTGIKHSAPNVIRLYGQAAFFDADPGLIIVPILTLDEVKAWKGEPYDALAMAGEVTEKVEGHGNVITSDFPTVCQRIRMTTEGGREANHREIEAGRELLTSVLLGMAYSLVFRSPDREPHLTRDQRKMLTGYRKQFPADEKDVLVPEPNPDAPAPMRVRVVEFRGATDVHDETKNLAPDPLLLAVRAAINWSRRRGQQLLAAAEPPPDAFETEYERRIEQFLESEDQALRPPDDDLEEFARRLGQLPPKGATAAAR